MAINMPMSTLGRWLGGMLLVGGLFIADAGGTTFLYKQYVVKQDLGQDVLCEPYEVQKDDWVYKIFRRKGEISDADFPRFLEIFQRINPHIEDLDRIRVGERILIPLRMMAVDADEGHETADDVVTLPFVTISNASSPDPPKQLPTHSEPHQVESGDTVHRLIATQFGPPGSEAYGPALERFKALNPQIKDLNKIYAGQVIQIPSRDLPQDLQTEIPLSSEPESEPKSESGVPEPVPSIMELKPPEKIEKASSPQSVRAPLETVAALLGGNISTQGKYHFPAPQRADVVIDTASSPVWKLPTGKRLLFARDGEFSAADGEVLRQHWPDLQIVSLNTHGNAVEQLRWLLGTYGAVQAPPNITVREPGLTLTARVNWILENTAGDAGKDISRIALTLLTDAAEQTPPVVQRYFADHGWTLREVVSQGPDLQILSPNTGSSAFSPGRVLSTRDARTLMIELIQVMGFTCAPNSQVKFTYAGLELSAWADLVQNGDGQQLLLNFGQIQGEAVDVLMESGLQVVDLVRPHLLRDQIVALFQALDVSCTYDPVFWAAARGANYNTSITATGLLASPLIGRQFLITPFAFSPLALQIFQERGIQVIQLQMASNKRKSAGWD